MPEDAGARQGRPRWSLPSLPSLPWSSRVPAVVAAAGTGVVCGLVATLLVWGGEQGCDAVRGRPSCGGYGLFMLVAIGVVCFLLGALLLRGFDVEHPGVTTFFGLAIPMLVILAFLIDYVFDTWMAFVLPLMVGCCFVLSAYLARWLDAANPSPYADDRDDSADDDGSGQEDEDAGSAELPRYTPKDRR